MDVKISPSGASMRMACPGSSNIQALYPEREINPYSQEGQIAHRVAAYYLEQIKDGVKNPFSHHLTSDTKNRIYQYIPACTEEMKEGAKVYCDYIYGHMRLVQPIMYIEKLLHIDQILPGYQGTPDCWFVIDKHVHIFDYKFGFAAIESFENWQLLAYAIGVKQYLFKNYIESNPESFTLHIVQPRGFHKDGPTRSWNLDLKTLVEYQSKLMNNEILSKKSDAPRIPGSHCRNCRARHVCEEAQNHTLETIDTSSIPTPTELNPIELGRELKELIKASEILNARITGLSEEAFYQIKKGKRVANFTIERSPTREVWKVPPQQIIDLGDVLHVNLRKPDTVLTPKQAEKAGISKEIVKSYSEIPLGALKLVPEDLNKTRKIFEASK